MIRILIFLLLCSCYNLFGQSLESGKPIMLATESGYGPFPLPSINGFVMGMAHINGNTQPDLLMSSDRYNPGTFVYPFQKLSSNGVPVFGSGTKIAVPFPAQTFSKSVVLETADGKIQGYWAAGNSLKFARFDRTAKAFVDTASIDVKGLPGAFSNFGALALSENSYLFLFTAYDTVRLAKYPATPTDPAKRHQYESYGQEGFWQQQLPRSGIYGAFVNVAKPGSVMVKPLTGLSEMVFALESYTLTRVGNQNFVVAGSMLGNILAYRIDEKKQTLTRAGFLKDAAGQSVRNPLIHSYITSFQIQGKKGLIVAGEGGIHFYEWTGSASGEGVPCVKPARHLLQSHPELYGSSLVVPELVDWDGDGDLDIVSGTSPGQIVFMQNKGTNASPKFAEPVNIQAGGYDIHIQPGYNQDIQGPAEARWGYSSPAVYDWTGDGLPDILTGDSRGKFNIYINKGTKQKPRLEPERPLFVDGLDLHGAWRVRPGVGKLGGRNAYIHIDTDDELRLYWQIDHQNLQDGGKLTIGDSIPIRANFKKGGEIGRSKITIVDWDQDGVKDLLVGTPRYATMPEPKRGMPYRLKNNGAAVLFFRNAGSEEKPVYEYPVPLRYKGKRLNFNQHECGVAVGKIGPGNSLNLIVGEETGRFYFFKREDLSWDKTVSEEYR